MKLNFEQVKARLSQRFPMIMVDKVLQLEPEKYIRALKNVTGNEIYFQGHFPEYSIMPGVYIIETIAQTSAILLSEKVIPGEQWVIGSVKDIRLLQPIYPGDQMIIEVTATKIIGNSAIVEGLVRVDDEIVTKGTLLFGKITIPST